MTLKTFLHGSLLAGATLGSSLAAAARVAEIQLPAGQGPYYQLSLPADVYQTGHAHLDDVHILDQQDHPLPFALRPQETTPRSERRPLPLYRLPTAATQSAQQRIQLQTRTDGSLQLEVVGASNASRDPDSQQWLIDRQRELRKDERIGKLYLHWRNSEWDSAVDIDASDDLRTWSPIGHGQLLALSQGENSLQQNIVSLEATAARYYRIRLERPGLQLTGVEASLERPRIAQWPTLRYSLQRSAAGVWQADLGGALPLVAVSIDYARQPALLPLTVAYRSDEKQPWQTVGKAVFYQLSNGQQAPAYELPAVQARWLQFSSLNIDPAVSPQSIQLQWRPAELVFLAQGAAPYRLSFGGKTGSRALPYSTLLPEGLRNQNFPSASLGAWQGSIDSPGSNWRLGLLWLLLIAGVAGLAVMAWQLWRGIKPSSEIDSRSST